MMKFVFHILSFLFILVLSFCWIGILVYCFQDLFRTAMRLRQEEIAAGKKTSEAEITTMGEELPQIE